MKDTAVPSVPKKMPSTFTVTEKEAPCLKGKEVGQMCGIEISGKVTGVREPDQWEKERGEKSIKYTIQIDKITGCSYNSRRV